MTAPNKNCTHPTTHNHGTRVCYVRDKCRCTDCRAAAADYARQLNKLNALRQWGATEQGSVTLDLVDAEPVRAHLAALSTQGMGWKRVTLAAGLHKSSVYPILYGNYPHNPGHPDHRPLRHRVSRRAAEAILAVQVTPAPSTRVNGLATRRRLQALVAVGWSMSRLAAELGMNQGNFSRIIHGAAAKYVSYATECAVAALYERAWRRPPTPRTRWDQTAITRARNYARQHGWRMPLDWDDDRIGDRYHNPQRSAA